MTPRESSPVLSVIRERGPKRPDETTDDYVQRVLSGTPRPEPEELPRLVALLRSGRVETAPNDGGNRG